MYMCVCLDRVVSAHAVLSDVHCRMLHLPDHGFVECCQCKLASDVVKLYKAVPLAAGMVLESNASIFAKRRKIPVANRRETSPLPCIQYGIHAEKNLIASS